MAANPTLGWLLTQSCGPVEQKWCRKKCDGVGELKEKLKLDLDWGYTG
jgi:hypothetical protein